MTNCPPQASPVIVPSVAPINVLRIRPPRDNFDGSRRKKRGPHGVYFDDLRMTELTYLPMPDADELELPKVLEALADPVRLEIVAAVAPGERPCGSFPLPVSD